MEEGSVSSDQETCKECEGEFGVLVEHIARVLIQVNASHPQNNFSKLVFDVPEIIQTNEFTYNIFAHPDCGSIIIQSSVKYKSGAGCPICDKDKSDQSNLIWSNLQKAN